MKAKTWKDIGKICAKMRGEKGLSLREMGQLMGISQTTLWFLERGKSPPSLAKLEQICNFLKVDFKIAKAELLRHKKKLLEARFK